MPPIATTALHTLQETLDVVMPNEETLDDGINDEDLVALSDFKYMAAVGSEVGDGAP